MCIIEPLEPIKTEGMELTNKIADNCNKKEVSDKQITDLSCHTL